MVISPSIIQRFGAGIPVVKTLQTSLLCPAEFLSSTAGIVKNAWTKLLQQPFAMVIPRIQGSNGRLVALMWL